MAVNLNMNIQHDSPNYQNVKNAKKSPPSPPRDAQCRGALILAGVCIGVMCIVQGTLNIVLRLYFSSQVDKSVMRCDNHTLSLNLQQLQSRYNHLKEEKFQLDVNLVNLGRIRDQLQTERDELQSKLSNIVAEISSPEWVHFRSSLYFMSTEVRTWSESRRDCKKRGADLVIVNTRQEQNFIEVLRREHSAWIGLSDQDEENMWKWVDGTQLASAYWWDLEPNDFTGNEDCAVTGYNHIGITRRDVLHTWNDVPCTFTNIWICEKPISI